MSNLIHPSANGDNGLVFRDSGGRFIKGNPGGNGNPFAKKTAELRTALYQSVSPDDIREIVKQLKQSALSGDNKAASIILDRILGPPVALDILERLAALETKRVNMRSEDEEH